jgi:hypothetical protein
MNSFAKTFSLSACALAASVLISACGGGTAGDTVAPTATVTSAASTTAGAAAGTKTFTFVFSESVGNSFSVEDLVVVDGTPSNFTKVSATNYTVDVTPTGSLTPTVILPAGKVFDTANNPNAVAFTVAPAAPTQPTTAAATPTALAANVISIYSDAYTNVAGTDFFPNWGQSSVVSDFPVAGNATKKVASLNYQGIALAAPVDVSGMEKLHIDVWSEAGATLNIGIITSAASNGGAALEKQLPQTLVSGWNSLDIPLTSFTSPTPNLSKIDQLILVGAGTVYYDNLYFWKAASAPVPTTAAITFDTATAPAFVGFDGAEASAIVAGPTGGSGNALKIVRNPGQVWAGAKLTGLTIQMTSTNPTITARVYSPAAGIPFVMKLETPGSSGDVQAHETVVAGWQTLSWTVSGANLTSWADLVFMPNLGTMGAGEIYYVDEITGPITLPQPSNPTADMGSGGAVTIPVATAPDSIGFYATGDAIFASDYVGTAETGTTNKAAFAGATTKGLASNGNIGFFNDPAMDTSSQKVEVGGWVSGSDQDAPGIHNFFRYYVFTGTATAFASSYMGLYVNAPNNGTVDVSTYANLKLKVWGPDPQFFNSPHLNPVLELVMTGPKVGSCNTGSGGTEISKNLTANQYLGAGSNYTIPLTGWTVKGTCGSDTPSTAVAAVLSHLARVVVTLPGSSFNFTNGSGSPIAYATGINLGPIGFSK